MKDKTSMKATLLMRYSGYGTDHFFGKVRNISGKIDMEGKDRCENRSESRMHAFIMYKNY